VKERMGCRTPVKAEELERFSVAQDAIYRYCKVIFRIVPATGYLRKRDINAKFSSKRVTDHHILL
jgi:hypothetical protein